MNDWVFQSAEFVRTWIGDHLEMSNLDDFGSKLFLNSHSPNIADNDVLEFNGLTGRIRRMPVPATHAIEVSDLWTDMIFEDLIEHLRFPENVAPSAGGELLVERDPHRFDVGCRGTSSFTDDRPTR